MEYSAYGKTGKMVSAIGFGGLRFDNPEEIDRCAAVVIKGFEAGINYFDTAPSYLAGRSELIFARAIEEMRRSPNPFYISTKSYHSSGDMLRRDLENSLRRLNVDKIDFFHCWYVLTLEDWESRKAGGAVDAIFKAKEEGLIEHAVFSTHLPGDEMIEVIDENLFEGVTLGYSAINYPYREAGLRAAAASRMGVAVMNPLAGGFITANPGMLDFLKVREEQDMLDAALHFLLSDHDINIRLIGFRNESDVETAIASLDRFKPYTAEESAALRTRVTEGLNGLCTTCRYCDVCPVDIPVWAFMDVYNYKMFSSSDNPETRLGLHWGASTDMLNSCIECRKCEEACTQHLPILERFKVFL